MRDGDGSFVALSRHVDILWGSRVIDPGGLCWWRGAGDICGVLPTDSEVGDVSGGCLTFNGTQPRKT